MDNKTIFDLSDFLNSNIPDTLYHYTNLQGFQGIIENSNIWMSNLFYLNDKNEYTLGINILREELNKYKEGFSVLRATKYYIEALESAINYIESNNSIFIFSLTSNNNLLSQWRGYTDNGIGVNIGIKKKFFTDNNLPIFKCIYNTEIQKKMASHIVTESIFLFVGLCSEKGIFDNQKDIKLSVYDEAVTIAGNFFMDRAIMACSLIKDSHFKEEDEWRVVFRNNDNFVFFFNRGLYLKPFIKFDIKDIDNVIAEIMLGPNPEQVLCESSLKIFVKQYKISPDKIRSSKIPYRN